jgi:hypothetical protein
LPSASSTSRYEVFHTGASTTYPTCTRRLPSPAKCSDTAFLAASWFSASTSRARRNSLSMTGLRNRSCCTSVSFTARIPSAHHRFNTATGTAGWFGPPGAACVSMPTIDPVSLPGWFAAVGVVVTSTRSPRACWRMPANVVSPFRLIEKLARVRAIGSRLS